MAMSPADQNILRTSQDARLLKNTAIACVKSADPNDHAALTEFLRSEDFLGRLDDEQSYRGTYVGLRLARVMNTVMEQHRLLGGSASLDRLLLSLIDSSDFQRHTLRRQLLIRALAVIKPSPEKAVLYWKSQSEPDNALTYDVIQALCVNQSEPAMALLAQRLADEAQPESQRAAWMQQIIMPIRNDAPILKACETALKSSMSADLKPVCIEALFDYKAEAWFMDCEPPKPPARFAASPAAREILERIGRYALAEIRLDPDLRGKVVLGLKEIGVDLGEESPPK
jgi:hypothetical protein